MSTMESNRKQSALIVLLCTFSTLAAANTRYNRLNVLQRSLNAPTFNGYNEDTMVAPLDGEESKTGFDYKGAEEGQYTLTANNFKREGVRRCGMMLIKHIQKVCNGCVGRPRSSEESGRKKRSKILFVLPLIASYRL
jgi:hypothetical protein